MSTAPARTDGVDHSGAGDARVQGLLVGALERVQAVAESRLLDALLAANDVDTGELAAFDLRSSRGAGAVARFLKSRLDAGARGDAAELLESKLLEPQIRGGLLPRDALVGLLEDSEAPVVCLSAGPGWGKTTLLAQWASRSQRPFAWLAVDERDNDPIVLLTYVAAALDRVSPLDSRVFHALASPGASVEATVVPRLGAALAAMDEHVVLALDNVHLVDNPVCLDAIAALARHIPEGSHIALSARGRPVLPLGALRARGLVLEIGPDELRLDEAGARQLLTAGGVDLPKDRIAELTEQTEGWSAGLYLAVVSIRAQRTSAKGGATFSGSNRLVSDYLRTELLEHSPPEELRFLTRTSVLERMSGPLCDVVLEQDGSAAVLESLERSNLFLVPLDDTGEWYRYHHLFRDLLRSELARCDAELVPRLYTRASEWCAANGQPETAIGYAQEAGDAARVADLVERCAAPAYQSGRVATVERWLEWLDAHGELEQNAAVAVLGAIAAAVGGRPAQAARLAEMAERAKASGPLPDGSQSSDGWLAFLSALLCRRGVAAMRADADRAAELIPRGSQVRPSALVVSGIARWLQGEVDEADDIFAEAAEGLEVGAPEPAGVALAERAMLALSDGRWVAAEELAERSLSVLRRASLDEYPTSAAAYAVGARISLHRGDTQRGQELMGRSHQLRPRLTTALPYFSIQVRLELARAYLSIADSAGARTLLREADALVRHQPDLGTLPPQVAELRDSLETMHVDAPGASTLTTAELRLLPYLGTHLSFREMGQRLYLSQHTVKSQAIATYRKLGVNSRSAAVARAHEFGLL